MVTSHSTFIITTCFLWSKASSDTTAPISAWPVASTTASTRLSRVARRWWLVVATRTPAFRAASAFAGDCRSRTISPCFLECWNAWAARSSVRSTTARTSMPFISPIWQMDLGAHLARANHGDGHGLSRRPPVP